MAILEKNQNQVVVFSEDTAPVISEILRKYDLEETDDETFEKLEKGIPLRGEVILNITEEITLGTTSTQELTSSLQKNLNIPKEIAEKLTEDIKRKLIALAQKVPKEDLEPEEGTTEETVLPREKTPYVFQKPSIAEDLSTPETPTHTEKEKPSEEQSDTYREPIG